jgi:hypothetical protein
VGDQRAGAEHGQDAVLGVEGVRPVEQAGGPPRALREHAVAQQPDPQPCESDRAVGLSSDRARSGRGVPCGRVKCVSKGGLL